MTARMVLPEPVHAPDGHHVGNDFTQCPLLGVCQLERETALQLAAQLALVLEDDARTLPCGAVVCARVQQLRKKQLLVREPPAPTFCIRQ
jgi:hypothetical protein